MTELVLPDGEVIDQETIASEINAEHNACRLAGAEMVTHAINVGNGLTKVKGGLKHGEFMSWVARHCDFGQTQACAYMKVSNFHRTENLTSATSLNDALRMIADESTNGDEESNGEDEEQSKPRRWTKSERERKKAVEAGGAVTANIKTDHALIEWAKSEGLYVRIDRKTDWGNPYVLEEDGDRVEVLESFGLYLNRKWGLQGRFDELRGKVLGCWCYPDACHGNVLIEQLGTGASDETERVGCHR